MVARSNEPLQSEAGYIDARPKTRSTKLLATHGRTIHAGQILPIGVYSRHVRSPSDCRRNRCNARDFGFGATNRPEQAQQYPSNADLCRPLAKQMVSISTSRQTTSALPCGT